MNEIDIQNYYTYLLFINKKIESFFEKQKPYIFCYRGCGKCCKHAMFPYSEIEFQYLMLGALQLPKEVQDQISNNIKEVFKAKKKYRGKKFRYDCPFLINNECSVYNFRGIVCRTFGLIVNIDDNKSLKAPFCCFQGLNYSNVVNKRTKQVSVRKLKKLGDVPEPTGFNIGYEFLTDSDIEQGFKFKFGEKKPLIDWFKDIE